MCQQDSVKNYMFSDRIGPDHTIQLEGLDAKGYTVMSGDWDSVKALMKTYHTDNVFEVSQMFHDNKVGIDDLYRYSMQECKLC